MSDLILPTPARRQLLLGGAATLAAVGLAPQSAAHAGPRTGATTSVCHQAAAPAPGCSTSGPPTPGTASTR